MNEYGLSVPLYPVECVNSSFSSLEPLHEHGIISWPNFSHCLPHCGLCQSSASDSAYSVFNLLLIGCLLPLIGFCGLVGNGLSAFIYSRPEMRSSTNLYLCALGCSDSGVICTAIFLFCIDSIRRFSSHLSMVFGALSPIIYPAGMTAQTCSVYFTLAAGADCFVQVFLPRSWRWMVSTSSFVKGVIIAVVLFGIIYNIPHCFEAVVLECWHEQFRSRSLEMCPDPFRFQLSYTEVYYKYMYAIFLAVGPLIILVILNSCIVVASVARKTEEGSGDTIALVLVVLLFIICNTTALLLNVFEARLARSLGSKINYIVDASNFMVVFNSSSNFIIYVTFSGSFRQTLRNYLFKTADLENEMRLTGRISYPRISNHCNPDSCRMNGKARIVDRPHNDSVRTEVLI
ncbi:hypothetical protein AB6A40_000288 [Gnathostoma spinigerum]|uniref:G-protein coupled receptors family 1 profile domain-containing protein n=1 Tax=Gnathostoma spinigerum TaxID=75299 RepID=A0ABD6E8A1_9BILA